MKTLELPSVELTVKTVPLSVKLLKQIPLASYLGDAREIYPYLKGEKGQVLGWIHGSVLDPKEDYHHWILIKTEKNEYIRFECTKETAKKYQQIYI